MIDVAVARGLRLAAAALLFLAGCEGGINLSDSGGRVDGIDAGRSVDAGTPARDADASEDGGASPGPETPADAGGRADAGQRPDPVERADAGQDSGVIGPVTPPKPSAGCSKGGGAPAAAP